MHRILTYFNLELHVCPFKDMLLLTWFIHIEFTEVLVVSIYSGLLKARRAVGNNERTCSKSDDNNKAEIRKGYS